MERFKEFVNKHVLLILFVVFTFAAFFFLGKWVITQMNVSEKIIESKSDTIREIIQQPPVKVPEYVVKEIHDTLVKEVIIPKGYEIPLDNEELRKRYSALLSEHFTIREYEDSIALKDSAGVRIGVVNIKDKVTANKLLPRNTSYQLSIQREIITNTNSITLKPRRKLLLGVEGSYTQGTPFNSAGVAALYQDRQNRMVKLSIGQQFSNNERYIGIGFYAPLSFRKK